ncbi:hypothetical protein V496_07741 [Pseudogymnoascus sp. VKM F-4515 (FW-2607)]|nr:hypothetical protein V496_07741 [Pseudogymnoascus sp. VKM F-4515 (FW-2607)]
MADAAVENPATQVLPHRKQLPSSIPNIDSLEGLATDGSDEYSTLKKLQRHLEYIQLQEEYIKDEQRSLKRELVRAQEEIKRIQSVPLVIGQFMEAIDQNTGIVQSSTGSNYVVRILSTLDREKLKPSSSVALHRHSNALVDILPPEADSSIAMLGAHEKPDVTYADVGGLDMQKQEIREAVELPLTHFDLYRQIGIDPPRGVLLYGPPGTGKTMLVKAVANSTTANFIRVVGSEFVQKYLGEGPRMVRDVFRMARENSPAIIFIDEIDAIATKRFDAQTGADREVQRILLELLNQMDGFDQTSNVKVIMATNRADTLDPALLRPGRLDRKIEFPNLRDRRERRLIFTTIASKMSLSPEVDLDSLIIRNDPLSGAIIAAIMQEAGLRAVRKNRYNIIQSDLEDAYSSQVKAGAEKDKSREWSGVDIQDNGNTKPRCPGSRTVLESTPVSCQDETSSDEHQRGAALGGGQNFWGIYRHTFSKLNPNDLLLLPFTIIYLGSDKIESIVKMASTTQPTYALSQAHKESLEKSLLETDPEIAAIMEKEIQRQRESIILIASENVTSRAVFDALGSPMSNKYSEGYPGARYYGGNEHIDAIELTCQARALTAFNLDKAKWGVNVQCLSGSPANLQVYQAIMRPHERLMGLDLPHGGHLSHGYQTPQRKISAVSTYFETFPYRVNIETGIIDYEQLEQNALMYRPKVLVAGTSAYCRLIDYKRMREIADKVGAYLVVDMAHISGLIAAGVIPSPFEYADIVTTTTHKSLRGPRGAMIFFRRGVRSTDAKTGKDILYDLENPINFSVFPGHQGGPHNHTITALAVALKQANTPEFKQYQEQVVKNAKAIEIELKRLGYKLVADGTDSHMVLMDLRAQSLDGARVEAVLEQINIACNKNAIPGDKSALSPCGIRIGTPAMTSRGFGEEDFKRVASYIDQTIQICKEVQAALPKPDNKLKDFRAKVAGGEIEKINALRKEIASWASSFPLPVEGWRADKA